MSRKLNFAEAPTKRTREVVEHCVTSKSLRRSRCSLELSKIEKESIFPNNKENFFPQLYRYDEKTTGLSNFTDRVSSKWFLSVSKNDEFNDLKNDIDTILNTLFVNRDSIDMYIRLYDEKNIQQELHNALMKFRKLIENHHILNIGLGGRLETKSNPNPNVDHWILIQNDAPNSYILYDGSFADDCKPEILYHVIDFVNDLILCGTMLDDADIPSHIERVIDKYINNRPPEGDWKEELFHHPGLTVKWLETEDIMQTSGGCSYFTKFIEVLLTYGLTFSDLNANLMGNIYSYSSFNAWYQVSSMKQWYYLIFQTLRDNLIKCLKSVNVKKLIKLRNLLAEEDEEYFRYILNLNDEEPITSVDFAFIYYWYIMAVPVEYNKVGDYSNSRLINREHASFFVF